MTEPRDCFENVTGIWLALMNILLSLSIALDIGCYVILTVSSTLWIHVNAEVWECKGILHFNGNFVN